LAQAALIAGHVQAQNFPGLAFHGDLEWAAADFAIRGELLRSDAGVQGDVERLATEWALDSRRGFHGESLAVGMVGGKEISGGHRPPLQYKDLRWQG
jgi:hypothetical protein